MENNDYKENNELPSNESNSEEQATENVQQNNNVVTDDQKEIEISAISKEINEKVNSFVAVEHESLLRAFLNELPALDFKQICIEMNGSKKVRRKDYLVITITKILEIAKTKQWGMAYHAGGIYIYNGEYWKKIDMETFKHFLGFAAVKLGVNEVDARYHVFKSDLLKQFFSQAHLPRPNNKKKSVHINLKNGTFEMDENGQILRPFSSIDFLRYQLPYNYDPNADCRLFKDFLDKVLPDQNCQKILAEYIGYIFIRGKKFNQEKILLLYGTGANGKSVFFNIIDNLLGKGNNVTNYPLSKLTDDTGYYRAQIGDALLNYSSEINGNLEASTFKKMASGEPIDARSPYGEPFILTEYAKFIFNTNLLPREVELTHAFFRRFIIIPFEVQIPESEQDKELANKIIENELSGVFNWVLEGLTRFLQNGRFTYSDKTEEVIKTYQKQSDPIVLFIEDECFVKSTIDEMPLKEFYQLYRCYCIESGYRQCSLKTFSDRLKKLEFEVVRKSQGNVVYIKKDNLPF